MKRADAPCCWKADVRSRPGARRTPARHRFARDRPIRRAARADQRQTFDSVLKERPGRDARESSVTKEPAAATAEPSPAASRAEPAPAPDAVPPAVGTAMALGAPSPAGLTPAAEIPTPENAAGAETVAPAEAPAETAPATAAVAGAIPVAVTVAPVLAPRPLGAPNSPPAKVAGTAMEPASESSAGLPQPETEARVARAAPVRGDAAPTEAAAAPSAEPPAAAKAEPAKAIGMAVALPDAPRKHDLERAERAEDSSPEVPQRDGLSTEPAVRDTVRAVAPTVAGTEAQGLALRDTAPPAWHLTVDAGQGPGRLEATQAQAPGQAQASQLAGQPQAIVGQVSVAIGRASSDDIEIRLDPPELGRVQIHLTRHDGGIQAMVLSDRPETHDLLRRHAEALARELGSAGFDNVSLDFAAGGEARPGRDEARGLDWMQAAPSGTAAATPEPTAPRTAVRDLAGGLDIRL